MKNTWRFVLKIVGASLALASLVCLIVASWDKILESGASVKKALQNRGCSEFDDYDDEFFCE